MAKRTNELVHYLQGRFFSLNDLKKAIVQSCQGYLNGFYVQCWDLDLWELVEAIELVAEVNKRE